MAGAPDQGQRRRQLGIIAGLALLLVAVIVVVTQVGGDDDGNGGGAEESSVEELYAGIPQDGNALGEPDAPATMIEFADPQCPFCADYSTDVLPDVIDRYVRPGDLRLELNLLTFLGPDSDRAARMALAAGLQGHLWEFIDAFYRDQGAENSGYATDDFLRDVAEKVPGLDVDQAFADRTSPEVDELLADAADRANELRVNSTPSFFGVRGNGDPRPLEVGALEPEAFTAPLDELTRR